MITLKQKTILISCLTLAAIVIASVGNAKNTESVHKLANKKEMVKTISFLFASNEPNLSSTIVRASSKAKPTSRTEKIRIENVNISLLKVQNGGNFRVCVI